MEENSQIKSENTPLKPSDSVVEKDKASKNKTIKITLTIPTGAYFLSGLRNLAFNIAKEMTGFSEKWAYRWQSVIDELINNAIEHGSAANQEIKIIFISHYLESVEAFIEDTGTGPIKKTANEMNQYLNSPHDPQKMKSIRGRGLCQIASQWSDQLDFKDNDQGGLTIHVLKRLSED